MPGQYTQSFNFQLIKNILNITGDQLITQGGIAWQLTPDILPNTPKLACRLIWRSSGFTSAITIKGVLAAVPNTLVGTEVFSQSVNTDDWQDSGVFEIDTPSVPNWITIVSNNPSSIFGAQVRESALYIQGLGVSGGMFLSF